MTTHRWPRATVALIACLTASCGKEPSLQKVPRPVRVEVVAPHASIPGTRYSANIEPYEQVAVAFKMGGYVSEIRQAHGSDGRMRNLQEGDRVTRGTVLARVRENDYVEAVNRANAALAGAEAGLRKAALDFERAKRLFENESLTKPDYDAAQAAYEIAQAQAEGARAALAAAKIQLQDTALVAPTDGVILKRLIEVGTLVGAGTVGFVMADTLSVKAVFGVPDLLMRRARLGIRLSITTEAYGTREFPGKITAISPAADPSSRVFDVEVTIPNLQDLLKPGMIASVAVPSEDDARGPAKPALVVPLNAIVRAETGEGYAVLVVANENGKQVARRRAVTIGQVYGNRIAILQGLSRGEHVILSGATLVSDGDEVRVIP